MLLAGGDGLASTIMYLLKNDLTVNQRQPPDQAFHNFKIRRWTFLNNDNLFDRRILRLFSCERFGRVGRGIQL